MTEQRIDDAAQLDSEREGARDSPPPMQTPGREPPSASSGDRESAAARQAPSDEPEAGGLLSLRVRHWLVAWLGAFIVIGATWRLFDSQQLVFAFASLGGSAVILFGMPDSPMAQPRSLFGGHAIASGVGLLFAAGFGTNAWSLAAAMATALVAMLLTRTVHSPAGADPIIIMTTHVSGTMVMLNLSVGLLLLWLVALVLLNGFRIHDYNRDAHRVLRRFVLDAYARLRRRRG